MINLYTERLIIRPFLESDAPDLYEYLSDPIVVKYEPYHPFSKEEALAVVKRRQVNPAFMAVELKSTGKVIGNLYLNHMPPAKAATYEIGYVFNRNYHMQGFATEAASALVDYTFNHLAAHRIIASCNTDNHASWRLLERLNFRREATHKQNMFFSEDEQGHPRWFDSYQYAILQSEWVQHGR